MNLENKIKTSIYIDGANLKKGIETLGWRLDYEKFYKWNKNKFKTIEIYIFLGYIKELENDYKMLEKIGYKIIFKQSLREKGVLKANCDAELILKLLTDYFYKNFDKAVIVSGDGDYGCVVDFLIKNNSFARIIAPNRQGCSIFLKRLTTNIVYVDLMRKVFEKIS